MTRSLGALLGAAAVLALGAGSALAKTEVRVVVAHYSDQTMGIFQNMANDFEAKHPDVDIKLEDVSWDNLQQRLTTDIAGGTAPDIAIIGTRWLVDYVQQDIAEPLNSYITPDFKAKFIEAFMKPSVIDGKTWGLPVAASARAMYYNKDLLAKAGVNEPPATWDELEADAKKVKALGGNVYGFGLQGKEIETDAYWYYALWSEGGELLSGGKSGIASNSGIKAATMYKRFIDEGITQSGVTDYNRQDIEALFKQGRVAMILSGPWLRGQIATEAPKLNYSLAAIPKGTTQATYGVTDSIMMFKTSKVKKEAWQFLEESAFSDKGRKEFTLKEGFLPVLKSVEEDPHFANDPQLKAFTSMLPYAHFAPLIPNWEQMADTTVAALQKIYLGQMEPTPALEAAAQKIDGLIQQ